MIFLKNKTNRNFSSEETVGSFISKQIDDVVSPIAAAEKNKATIYGGLGGAAIGGLAGGLGTYFLSGDKKKKKKDIIRNALIGAGLGGIGGAIGLRHLQGRKFENIGNQAKKWFDSYAPTAIEKIKDPLEKQEVQKQLDTINKNWDTPLSPRISKHIEKNKDKLDKLKTVVGGSLKGFYDKNVPWYAMSNPFDKEINVDNLKRVFPKEQQNFSSGWKDAAIKATTTLGGAAVGAMGGFGIGMNLDKPGENFHGTGAALTGALIGGGLGYLTGKELGKEVEDMEYFKNRHDKLIQKMRQGKKLSAEEKDEFAMIQMMTRTKLQALNTLGVGAIAMR